MLTAFISVFIVGAAGAPTPSWATSSLSFVQATVVSPDPAARTLGFVDASGRTRSHRVVGEAAARLGRLRPGDEVIVVLTGAEPVVQDVRVSHVVPPDAATPSADATGDPDAAASPWTVVPREQMRPGWPNPYSRFHRGAKPRRGGGSAR
jgi:hypothetical protein